MRLVAEKLCLSQSDYWMLRVQSTWLDAGQITAICGPNGAGKSTLLKGLAGLLEPVGGMVVLDETRLTKISPQERAKRIGYLPQSTEIAWDVAVENIVRLGRLPHRDRGTQAVEAAIIALDLEELKDRPASQLSGGERARVLLARVLAGEPDWILADEPLAALDLAHQLNLLKHLRAAADSGKGVVIVLHDLSLAMNFADRVLVVGDDGDDEIDGSFVLADGPPHEALSAEIIANVWDVEARWIGEDGARALIVS